MPIWRIWRLRFSDVLEALMVAVLPSSHEAQGDFGHPCLWLVVGADLRPLVSGDQQRLLDRVVDVPGVVRHATKCRGKGRSLPLVEREKADRVLLHRTSLLHLQSLLLPQGRHAEPPRSASPCARILMVCNRSALRSRISLPAGSRSRVCLRFFPRSRSRATSAHLSTIAVSSPNSPPRVPRRTSSGTAIVRRLDTIKISCHTLDLP